MKKTEFIALLGCATWDDKPVLYELKSDGSVYIRLKTENPYRDHKQIHTVRLSNDGSSHLRLTNLWLRYNRWLNRWYINNSPGNHLCSKNEHVTLLRASGYTEEQIQAFFDRKERERE